MHHQIARLELSPLAERVSGAEEIPDSGLVAHYAGERGSSAIGPREARAGAQREDGRRRSRAIGRLRVGPLDYVGDDPEDFARDETRTRDLRSLHSDVDGNHRTGGVVNLAADLLETDADAGHPQLRSVAAHRLAIGCQ